MWVADDPTHLHIIMSYIDIMIVHTFVTILELANQ